MNKYLIKAYADIERRLKEQEMTVYAKDREEAIQYAWIRYPEYKQVGAYLIEESRK